MGCRDDAGVVQVPSVSEGPVSSQRPSSWQGYITAPEVGLARLSDRIPGFAGYYFDESDELVVRLTDLSRAEQARTAVAERMRFVLPEFASGLRDPGSLRVEPATFSFLDLAYWHHVLTDELGRVEGVVWSDVDEVENRVVVGVEPEHLSAASLAIAGLFGTVGVPPDAVTFIASDVPTLDVGPSAPLISARSAVRSPTTLLGHQRPLQGGYKVVYKDQAGGSFNCSIGFVTMYNGQPAFVTASHCSRKFGEADNTPYAQPYFSAFDDFTVGTEAHDPDWFHCNWLKKCRMTDTNIVSFVGSYSDIDHGRVARTLHSNGSKDVDQQNPYFTIAGQMPESIVGQEVHKMGQATGWTVGEVTRTCLTSYISHDGGTVRVNCTDEATYHRGSGDSGAPIFLRWSDTHVYLYGIHHAGNSTHAFFSRMARVQEDLGGVTIRPSSGGGGPGCPDPPDLENPC
jgi:hypothetical protein